MKLDPEVVRLASPDGVRICGGTVADFGLEDGDTVFVSMQQVGD